MNYQMTCVWCRKQFTAKRKDNILCSNKCKTDRFRIVNGFTLVDPFLPEDAVNDKYRKPQSEACIIYLHWFKMDGKRFADVYISKDCSPKLTKKMTKKFPFSTHTVPEKENGSHTHK